MSVCQVSQYDDAAMSAYDDAAMAEHHKTPKSACDHFLKNFEI
jgi:hypothetical protein